MRANILAVLLVLLLGVGASLLLIPRSGELALQKFRDRDYASARADYEARYAAGDHGAGTVMPLTKLHMAEGEVERAIALMESFVARAPQSLEGRDLLGRLYQDAQRQGDYLDNLRELARLRGTDEAHREVAYLAGFQGRLDVQVEALTRYCELRPDDAQTQQELAALLASQGDHAGAVDWLVRADDRAEGRIEADSRELLMSLLIDLDRAPDAFRRAQRWLGEEPAVADAIGLASQLAAAGRPDLGLRLIEPLVAAPDHPLALELTFIDLQLAAGRTAAAQARLNALPDRVEEASFGRLLALRMNAGLERAALGTARAGDLRLVPDWVLTGLADIAFRDGDRAFLDRLVTELGDGFLEERPVLAANIALGRGDAAAAVRWAERGMADAAQPLPERLAAVRILDRAGRRTAAAAGFDRLPLDGGLPDDLLEEVGALFLDLDRAAAGLAWFEARRRAAPSRGADLGWVRLAARAGDPAAVAAWLDAHPTLDEGLLQDIAGNAVERGATALALTAARLVFALSPTPRSRFALATALLAAGRPADALPHLTALLPARSPGDGGAAGTLAGAEVEAAYLAALDGAGRVEELTRFLSAKLDRGGLSDAEEQGIVFALLDRKAHRAVATVLHRLATTRTGGPWDALYRETLAALGRKAELRRYLLARAADDRLGVGERREVVFALLDLGEKAGAEAALRRLAAGQGPQSDDFKQLAYLWGPRPPAPALDWIEARARAAPTPAEQAAWYGTLAGLGGARRVAARLGQGGAPADADLKTPYIEALAAEGRGRELAEAIRSALAGERRPDRLRRYARLAEQARERATAAAAWDALLARSPDDGEALRQLGMLAYDENRLADAERLLRRFAARGPDDYEAHYFLGEALTALKRPAAAAPFYRTALAQLRAGPTRNDATAQTEANLLNRLGKVDEAVALFEGLRKRRPNDRQLKADYASLLVENGRLQEARRVLSLP